MLDNDPEDGFSPAAWFFLGAQEERARQRNQEWMRDVLAGRPVPKADFQALLAENENLGHRVTALAQENDYLRQKYEQAVADNRAWQEWGAKVRIQRDSLKQQVAALTADNEALRQDRDTAADFYQEALEGRREQVAELEKLVKKLRRGEG